MVDWISLAIPFAYLGILIGSLATFSSLYRKRKSARALSLAPWFPAHLQRDIYFSLLHLEQPAATNEKKTTAVPETVLKAALLRRAAEDIKRVIAIRDQKQALSLLLQRGSVGDDLWQRFLRAEKEMEEEVRDVVQEANAYVPNWGQVIFQSAREMDQNNLFRQRIEEYQSKVGEEVEWWTRRRAEIQEGFMKELDAEKAGTTTPAAAAAVTTAASATPAKAESTTVTAAPPSVTAVSDDDGVLVEAEVPKINSGTSSVKKKKKGKK
ncbi:translocation protein (Sec66), putative [Talaromyces stipitatus ATCC 10500]|uniref:Translocation protein (Sec66), putative n=1 Tax=Talaromyces stipitatus (strain ATCC 10500 / CBS 375.48 / QM 6759 / NRRL 1006) TaxID=441959 RepID=B8MHN7_TALSN|nr:translocation protein (Sec66), putative [Talaromyces stipitatus ATCC 10500]EED16018.1 translocation protein (Sec66), putative [Talaromyces stipitatus ATCC 10500]